MFLQSLFLESLSGQQARAAEVALAQAAAREAVGERGELEHMLTWLTGAHAEEAAMHRTFKAEVGSEICKETKYVFLKAEKSKQKEKKVCAVRHRDWSRGGSESRPA